MKKIGIKRIFSILMLTFLLSCQNTDEEIKIPQIINHPLPRKDVDDSIKILFIGSSWMKDTWWYCNKVIQASDVKATLGAYYYAGAGINDWIRIFKNNVHVDFFYSENGDDWQNTKKTLKDGIRLRDWDIIVFQQSAYNSFRWESYQPYLNNFTEILIDNATNERVCLALNETWTPSRYGKYIYEYGFENQESMYDISLQVIRKAAYESGVDIIVPCGIAVSLLRKSVLENNEDITVDGLHLDMGVGRYLTACTVFTRLVAPIYGKTIIGNSFRPKEGTLVTDKSAELIQNCAIDANKYNFGLD